MVKIKSDTLHVQGINVGIYTEDYCCVCGNPYFWPLDAADYDGVSDQHFG